MKFGVSPLWGETAGGGALEEDDRWCRPHGSVVEGWGKGGNRNKQPAHDFIDKPVPPSFAPPATLTVRRLRQGNSSTSSQWNKGGAKVNIIANVLSEAPPASAGGEATLSPEALLGVVLPIIAIMLKAGRRKNRPAYISLINKKNPPSAPQGTAVRKDGYKHATTSRQAHASFILTITLTRPRHPRHQKHSPQKKYPLTPEK